MKKALYLPLSHISEKLKGQLIITEGVVEAVYPIKEDRLKHYIVVDSFSPEQRGIYLAMDTTHRTYRVGNGKISFLLINAPLDLYEGKKIRFMAKVVKHRGSIALKFKRYV
jgi:hypothetical protein